MICKQCNTEYDAKRSTSLYCSPACKQESYRNSMSKPVTLSNDQPVTLTEPNKRRGKGITCFAHLPPDVQGTINRLSKDDAQEHSRRTAIAIDYQHKHPGAYYSKGAE